jgi:hypothetical protein
MPGKRTLLAVLGFLVTLVSTLMSGVFIHQSDGERAQLIEKITHIRDIRATAQAGMTESVAKIDSASMLFALAQAPSLESGARTHMIETCKQAIKAALCFKYEAITALHETMTDPPELDIVDCEDHDQTLEDFLAITQGKVAKYAQLLEVDSDYVEAWRSELTMSQKELAELQQALSKEEARSSLLRSLGTALGLLGVMIVLARDLVG